MTTYYDVLGISSSATQAEINNAIDQQYNHWRRLTTHHDQETVEKATQALRILEQVRTTLSDPTNRDKYNTSIGLGTQVGGLVDPSASSGSQRIPLAASAQPIPSAPGPQRIDAWVCSQCQTANLIGTRHCRNCGLIIGIDCPNCGKLTEATAKHCSSCGANIQDTIRKRKAVEEEQRRQREVQEAERIRLQREQERFRAEQASKELVKQKQQGRRSCFTWVFVIAGVLVCCVVASSIMPLALRNVKLPDAPVLQLPTPDPLIAAQSPKFSGTKISVIANLSYINDDQIQIEFKVQNLTTNTITLAFLSSDIVVSDDLGNIFQQRSGTQPIRDELDTSSYSSAREYSLYLSGSLQPLAKTINISFPALTDGEQPFQLAIPLTPIEKVSPGFETSLNYVRGDSFNLRYKFTNSSPYFFILRFKSSDLSVTDDLGNVYQINEYDAKQTVSYGLGGVQQYSNSQEYQWGYTPGLDPKAKQLAINITLMGQPFSAQIPLSVSNEKIRYEAKVYYAYPDANEFTIDITIFNLADTDFILRLDGNHASVTQGGTTFTAQADNERIGDIVSPGNSSRLQLTFDGNLKNQDNLLLILPLVSGTENIQIPVSPQE